MSNGNQYGQLPASSWPHHSVVCGRCRAVALQQPFVCASCGGTDLNPVDLEGVGQVEGVTTVAERLAPPNEGSLTVALVRLSQGPLILARASADMLIGDEVRLELISTASGELVPSITDVTG